jgi:hypothetical protein
MKAARIGGRAFADRASLHLGERRRRKAYCGNEGNPTEV